MGRAQNWKQYKEEKKRKESGNDITSDLVYLVRKHGAEAVKNEVNKMKDKSLFSKMLSMTPSSFDKEVFDPVTSPDLSQNDLLYDYVNNYVDF